MTVAIVAEKPSAARNMAAALGGTKGTYNGEAFVITNLRGHLYEFKNPDEMLKDPSRASEVKRWSMDSLPWDPDAFTWDRKPKEGVSQMLRDLRTILGAATEIAIATDIDPTGEGDLLFWEVADELNLHSKKFSRMEFTDEAAASIQKAFTNRRAVKSMQDEGAYRKADARTKMDLLTMQHTRIATISAAQQSVLRQGRLKSAMVKLCGDQLKAHNDYVKTPFFENRFRDENGVVYVSAEEPRFATSAEVPNAYSAGPVTLDERSNKRTSPPRLLDLASLSAILASKGVKAQVVLATYQKMYEDRIVSYPRTEDKHITSEQFNELLPHVDQIAAVVGVDTSIVSHRTPRRTHVKDSGAHGANRPGPVVPASLSGLATKYGNAAPLIYETLARNYLAMLSEDYVYERQEGHVAAYPVFKGAANVPKSMGWKQVFNETSEPDDDESTSGLGTRAEPFVHEGANTRPPAPTMKWLMGQLEKRDVGTGATRTGIYAEVTSEKHKFPLLSETRGRIVTTEHGEISYRLLPGTRIGDLGATESFYAMMKDIEAGTKTTDDALALVTEWVREDMKTMQANAVSMRKELGLSEVKQQKEKHEGLWAKTGEQIRFSREWGGVRFTDQQCADLLAGKQIEFTANKRAGGTFTAVGSLKKQTYNGNEYIGFNLEPKMDASGRPVPPDTWGGATFSDEDKQKLMNGEHVTRNDFYSARKKSNYETTVRFGEVDGRYKIIPQFDKDNF